MYKLYTNHEIHKLYPMKITRYTVLCMCSKYTKNGTVQRKVKSAVYYNGASTCNTIDTYVKDQTQITLFVLVKAILLREK